MTVKLEERIWQKNKYDKGGERGIREDKDEGKCSIREGIQRGGVKWGESSKNVMEGCNRRGEGEEGKEKQGKKCRQEKRGEQERKEYERKKDLRRG